MHRTRFATLVLAGALGACRSAPAPEKAPSFEGIYAVDRITKNKTGCDAEGPVVEDNVKFYYLRFVDAFGERILEGGGEPDLADVVRRAKGDILQFYEPTVFSRELDAPEPKGDIGQSAIPKDGLCKSNSEAQVVRWASPDHIRIEMRKVLVEFPGQTMSDCNTLAAVEAAAGKPCSQLTVVTAHKQQPLP